jgi:hypothetical protein
MRDRRREYRCRHPVPNFPIIQDDILSGFPLTESNDILISQPLETYVARNNRFDRDPRSGGHGKPWHLVLLAKDFTGYQHLVTMVTAHQGTPFKWLNVRRLAELLLPQNDVRNIY